MADEEVETVPKEASIDMDDETTAGPRGTVYHAKVIRMLFLEFSIYSFCEAKL